MKQNHFDRQPNIPSIFFPLVSTRFHRFPAISSDFHRPTPRFPAITSNFQRLSAISSDFQPFPAISMRCFSCITHLFRQQLTEAVVFVAAALTDAAPSSRRRCRAIRPLFIWRTSSAEGSTGAVSDECVRSLCARTRRTSQHVLHVPPSPREMLQILQRITPSKCASCTRHAAYVM